MPETKTNYTGVRNMARPSGKPTDTEPLEEEEYRKLIPHLKAHWQMFYELLWQTGIRVNEGLSLTKTDLEDGGIWIVREKRPRNPLRDWLPLTPELYQRIYDYCHRAHRDLIFPYTPQAAWAAIRKAGIHAGVRKTLHPHLFRHGLGHRAERAGISIPQIQRMLGHSNIKSTYVYVKPTKSETVEAFKQLNKGVEKQNER
jgi:integrase/recombinase XerD